MGRAHVKASHDKVERTVYKNIIKATNIAVFKGSMLLILSLLQTQAYSLNLSIADPELKQCIERMVKTKGWKQIDEITAVKCHSQSVQSLQGLELFTQLKSLSLYNNQLTQIDIDLSKLAQLEVLNLSRNSIQHLQLDNLVRLQKVYVFGNKMKRLTLINLPELLLIKAHNNLLQSFSYEHMPKLAKIYIFNNQLETVNIHGLPKLDYMDCRQNPMPDTLYDEMDKQESITFLHDGNAQDWQ